MPKFIIDRKTKKGLYSELDDYYNFLEIMHLDMQKINCPQYTFLSFVLFCAATLEYSINQCITVRFYELIHEDVYKDVAERFVYLPMSKKFNSIPKILTSKKLQFDNSHKVIKDMNKLVEMRNSFVHNKNYYQNLQIEKVDSEWNKITILSTIGITSNKEMCFQYLNSLKEIKEEFFDPILDGKELIAKGFLIPNTPITSNS